MVASLQVRQFFGIGSLQFFFDRIFDCHVTAWSNHDFYNRFLLNQKFSYKKLRYIIDNFSNNSGMLLGIDDSA